MNALDLARSAYAPATPLRTARGTEYQAFARITEQLATIPDDTAAYGRLVAALSENRQLWTILASDVAREENALPDQLRAQIFYLAEFTIFHSRKVLKGEGEVSPLIEINTAVMRGLRTSAGPE